MKRFVGVSVALAALVGIGLVLSGCGGGDRSTPQAAFETFKKAMVNDDFGGVWDSMSKNAQTGVEAMFKMIEGMGAAGAEDFKKEWGMTSEEFGKLASRDKFIKLGTKETKKDAAADKKDKDEIRAAELLDTKIDGDKATLKVKKGGKEEEMVFVKEDGQWKFEGK